MVHLRALSQMLGNRYQYHVMEHNIPSTTSSEVSRHVECPGHQVHIIDIQILDRDFHWLEQGVDGAIYIRVN